MPQNYKQPPLAPGFTIVELVVVIILLAILSAYAVPRFVGIASFQRSGFYQETVSAARYARQLAVGSGCPVRISFDASGSEQGYSLAERSNCTSGGFVTLSADSHPVSSLKDRDISIETQPSGQRNATFDALGRSSRGLTVTVNGRSFSIEQETGYVDTPS